MAIFQGVWLLLVLVLEVNEQHLVEALSLYLFRLEQL